MAANGGNTAEQRLRNTRELHGRRSLSGWLYCCHCPYTWKYRVPASGIVELWYEYHGHPSPTDGLMLYAAYKQAYKSGGFSIATLPTPTDPNNSFKDEKAEGGEIGLKSRLFDRQLDVNVAGYYYHYANLQVGVNEPAAQSNGEIVALTENAGSARSFGIDLSAAYRPQAIKGLNVNGELNWNNARYTTLNNVPCWGGQTIALGCNELFSSATGLYTAQNLNRTPMIRAPDWQLNFGFGYDFSVWRDMRMALSNNNAFSSKFVRALAINRPDNDNYQTSYIKSDLSLSLFPADDRWEVAVIGKDINGKLTAGNCASSNLANGVLFGGEITGGTTSGPAGLAQNLCYTDPGPQIWLRLTVRPFASHN
jgi:iron complex outermembrane receptor protein